MTKSTWFAENERKGILAFYSGKNEYPQKLPQTRNHSWFYHIHQNFVNNLEMLVNKLSSHVSSKKNKVGNTTDERMV